MREYAFIHLNVSEWCIECLRSNPAASKIVMECVIETKSSTILQLFDGLRGDVQVTFEEGTWAAWLYDLLKPHHETAGLRSAPECLVARWQSE